MTTFGLTDEGFLKKTASLIQTEYEELFKAIFGENIDLDSDGPFGQLAQTLAEREGLWWDLGEAVYHSQYRQTSSGQSLDAAMSLVFKSRIQATNSLVALTAFTFDAAAVEIPAGSIARQSTINVDWVTLALEAIPGATNTLTDLDIDNITHISGNTIRYSFLNSPDLSGVALSDILQVVESGLSANDGAFPITLIDNVGKTVDVTNTKRNDNAADETGSEASGGITNGYISISAQSQDKGAFEANAQTIDTIQTPVNNWDGVVNLADATTGTNEETDAEFMQRVAQSSVIATGGPAPAMQDVIAAVTGVTYAQIEQNRTSSVVGGLKPHSVLITVDGTFDPQDVVDAIGQSIGAGIDTNGSSSGTYTDEQGLSEVFYYNTLTQIDTYYIVNLTVNGDYPDTGDADVQQAIDDYIATLGRDDDVFNHLVSAAVSTAVNGITAITVLQGTSASPGTSANITIGTTERAVVDQANITVNS